MRISVKYVFLSLLICLAFTSISQPVANFVANKVNGCAPLTVQFTSLSTGNPSTYLWDFGNGNTSTLMNPSASYVNPGKYTVRLTVTNSAGSNQRTVNNYIDVYPLPIVNFGSPKLTGCTPLSILFKDSRCGYVGGETACDKTLARCKALNNVANFAGFPTITSQMVIKT
jgi:PKD repeat protein